MIKKIFSTAVTFGGISILNFLMTILVSVFLGKAGVAEMVLFVLGVSFIVILSNFAGGPSLPYLVSKYNIKQLLKVSYAWSFLSVLLISPFFFLYDFISVEYVPWMLAVGLLEGLYSSNIQVLIGKKEIKYYNFLKIGHKLITFLLFILLIFIFSKDFLFFIYSLFTANILMFLLSCVLLRKHIDNELQLNFKKVLEIVFNNGFQVQLANIIQIFNYRIIYIFIKIYLGKSSLGLFAVAVQLAESIWAVSKGISIVQLGWIANEKDEEKRITTTLALLKTSSLLTLILIVILCFIPEYFINWLFGRDYSGIMNIIWALSPGIFFLSIYFILVNYFSGKGIYKHMIIATLLGFIINIVFVNYGVKEKGNIGAGIIMSISYLITMIYLLIVFLRYSKLSLIRVLSLKDIVWAKNTLLKNE